MMSQVFFVSYSKIARISRHLGWDMLDSDLLSDLLSDFQVDFLSVCIIYNWLRVRFRIAHLAQDCRFACIGLADDEDAKLRHSARISSAFLAPCLNGRAPLDN